MVIALKLLLAPGLVLGATLAGRRWGEAIGGALGGLPVVVGPVLAILALERGDAYAARAGAGALLGLLSLSAFAVAYARAARRLAWPGALLLAWAAAALITWGLDAAPIAPGPALVLALAALLGGRRLLGVSAEPSAGPHAAIPAWDLGLRAGVTALLVLSITGASATLGSHLSGLLASLPILTTVLAVFTHARLGPEATERLLGGLLLGCVSFAAFCFVVAVGLSGLGTAGSLLLAAVASVVVHALLLRPGGPGALARPAGRRVSDRV
ncbi:MAG TPA: hypothetical protein VGN69_08000 [Solirubrobacteraceae bacterium]|nr:hypothetical protein [Solirubrobacteraceae bacterium]